jgi:drug/metabolite transporter (DMT)-like permease
MTSSSHTGLRAPALAVAGAMLIIYTIWGSTYLAIRFAVETLPPFLFAAVRFALAGGALYVWRRASGDRFRSPIEWRSAAVVGLFLLVGGNGSLVWAEQRVPSGPAALLIATVPLWMALIDWLRPGGKRPTAAALLGVCVGFVGILILIGLRGFQMGGGLDPVGSVVLVLGAFLWAAGSLYNRGARLPESPLLGVAVEMLAGAVGLFILAMLAGDWGRLNLAAVSARSLISMAYLIVFGSLIAFSAYVWVLRVAPTPLVSTYAYVNPVVAIFLGSALAAEPLTPRTLAAAFVILGAVLLTSVRRRAPNR